MAGLRRKQSEKRKKHGKKKKTKGEEKEEENLRKKKNLLGVEHFGQNKTEKKKMKMNSLSSCVQNNLKPER